MKCTPTKRPGFVGNVCERCGTNWFDSVGSPWCFPQVHKGHEKKLEEVVAKVKEEIELSDEEFFRRADEAYDKKINA